MVTPRIRLPTTRVNSETSHPLTTTGSDRPRNSGSRGAGVARTMPRVWVCRSPAMVVE
jgi:hypothetical protein